MASRWLRLSEMVRERPDLLGVLVHALETGVAAPRENRTLEQEADLQGMLMARARQHLLTHEVELIARCSRLTSVGVKFARTKDSHNAFRSLSLASKLASSGKLSPMALLLCKGPQEAAEAYHDYKDGDLIGASRHLLLALSADEALESEYGLTMLHWHRVHLMNNFVRVRVAGGETLDALQLSCKILCYLQGDRNSAPGPGKWSGIPRDRCYQAALKGMFVQTCIEMSPVLESIWRLDEATGQELAKSAAQQLCATSVASATDWDVRALAWFRAKLLQTQDVEQYVLALGQFLSMGPGASPLLWKSALKDCEALATPPQSPEQKRLVAVARAS